MENLVFITIATALLSGQALCRPEHSVDNRFHHFQGLPVIHNDGLLTGDHNDIIFVPVASQHNDHERYSHQYGLHLHENEHVKSYQGPIAVPVVLPSGHLADTPEVSAAKEHHLSAVAQAKADKYYSGHTDSNYGGAYGYSGSYHGYAVPVVLPNGHIADTEEVAAAKSAHLLAVAKVKAEKYYSGYGDGYGYGDYGFSGSFHGYGIPVVLPNGHLADTHEVAAAKSAHLVAVQHAKAKQFHAHHQYLEDNHKYVVYGPHTTTIRDFNHQGHFMPIYESVQYVEPVLTAHSLGHNEHSWQK